MKEQSNSQSQVREIINKLNDDHPTKESSRQVVTRKDGSKVTRVTKKRRVTISEQDKARRSRRKFTLIFGAIFAFFVLFAAYLGLKLSLMGGQHYLQERSADICQALNAESIEMEGANIDGFSMKIDKLKLKYPSASPIEHVEIETISGRFDLMGLTKNKLNFELLNIAKLTVTLKSGAETIPTPATTLSSICDFTRIDCKNFNLTIGDIYDSPISIFDTNAYLYYPDIDKSKIIFSCRGGQFVVKNWLEFNIKDLRAAFIDGTRADLSADLSVLAGNESVKSTKEALVTLRAGMQDGDRFYGPYNFSCSNVSVQDLTQSRLAAFFTANTKKMSAEDDAPTQSTITFSPKAQIPSIRADLNVGDITWSNLPALQEIQKHVESAKRSLYTKLLIPYGRIQLISSPEEISLTITEGKMVEPYSISLAGQLKIDAQGLLSGTLDYGVPASLTRREYPDGLSDPIFKEEGASAWLRTKLSGTKLAPDDNSLDIHLEAEAERKNRPKPNSLDVISVDVFADRIEENKILVTE